MTEHPTPPARRPRHQVSGNRNFGIALAFVTVACWATLPVALKIVLTELDAVTVTWFRFAVALAIGGGWVAASGRLRQFAGLARSGWVLLWVAALMLTTNYVLYLFGLDRVSPGNAQVTLQLAPVLMALGGIVLFGERYGAVQWVAFFALLGGLGLFFRDQIAALVSGADRYAIGIGLLVASALVWVVYSMAQKQLLRDLGSQTVLAFIYLVAAAVLLPFARPGSLAALDAGGWAALAFCALNTLVAYGALAEAMNHWEASRVGAVIALVPLGAVGATTLAAGLWPHWIEPERIGIMGWVGAVVVMVASMTISLAGRRPAPAGTGIRDKGEEAG